MDGYRAFVREFGATEFVLTGGVVGTIYRCGQYVGQTNLFMKLIDDTERVERLCERITDRNIERIRFLAAAGGDAIYIDDATATSDMISVAMYERFSLPYMKRLVDEIHRLGHKAIVIYFGGVMDRLEQIASLVPVSQRTPSGPGTRCDGSQHGLAACGEPERAGRHTPDRYTLVQRSRKCGG